MSEKKKTCFVASTIGEEGSDPRKIADLKYNHVFEPVLELLGYETIRADKLAAPNLITSDIVNHILHSDLMIADISDKNPNVFYELGVRNTIQKPVIVIREIKQQLPFDIYDKRAILIDMTDPDNWVKAKDELKEQVIASEKDKESASKSIVSPFSVSTNLDAPLTPTTEIALKLKDLQYEMRRLRNESRYGVTNIQRDYSDYAKTETSRFLGRFRMARFMETLKTLEGDKKEPVLEDALISALIETKYFTSEEAVHYIRKMLREATIYEAEPGYYCTV